MAARSRRALQALVIAGLVSSCTSTLDPPVLGSERSFDGLWKVENSQASAAWMRRGLDLSGYTKVRLEGAGVDFRPLATGARNRSFPITDSQEARLVQILAEAFRQELGRSERFELVEEKGPDVLTLWGGLIDVVSFVPPERGTRGEVFLRSVGEATLVIELRDAQSRASLARIVDRRAANKTGPPMPSTPVTNWAEVRSVARRWAMLVRTRLDASAGWKLAPE